MLKRGMLALAVAAALLGAGGTPAGASPPPPPGQLRVVAYYDDPARSLVVGMVWAGCDRPSGTWGDTNAPYSEVFFMSC
jgi:hypothetical protein